MENIEEKIDFNEIIESIEQLEVMLVEYEESFLNNINKSDLVHIIFRQAHNLKSTLFVIRKSYSSRLIHSIESHFDLIRKGRAIASEEVLHKCLAAIDLIRNNVLQQENEIDSELLTAELEYIYNKQLTAQKDISTVKVGLNTNELSLLEDALKHNLNIYQVEKMIEANISPEDYAGLFIYEDIKEIGFHINTYPKFADIDKTNAQAILKIIFATKSNEDELAMYIFDPVKQVYIEPVSVNNGENQQKLKNVSVFNKSEQLLKPLKILIIEEDFFSRRLLNNILSEWGTCDIACNGEEAVIAFKHELENGSPYNLVTTDIIMDKLDGHQTIKLIREIEQTIGIIGLKSSSIMVISALDNIENILNSFREQANTYLTKPVTSVRLMNELAKLGFIDNSNNAEPVNTELITELSQEISRISAEIKSLISDNLENMDEIHQNFYIIKNIASFIGFNLVQQAMTYTCCLFEIISQENKNAFFNLIQLSLTFLDKLNQALNDGLTDIAVNIQAELVINTLKEILEEYLPQEQITTEEINYPECNEEDIDIEDILNDKMFEKYLSEAIDLVSLIEIKLVELEQNASDKVLISELLGYIHNLKGNSGFLGIADIENISMEIENILADALEEKVIIDRQFTSDILQYLDAIKTIILNFNDDFTHKLDFNNHSFSKTAQLEKIDKISENIENTSSFKKKDIRVETLKLDRLFDLVGELITTESILINDPELKKIESDNFQRNSIALNKITRELQEVTMSVMMIPLESLFNRMKRLVRDLSYKTGKKINFVINGQDTEMDKNIIEEISDPLVHILRNAIDHGIEPETNRLEKDKNLIGTLKLSARYEGNEILVVVEDDGKGLDKAKILEKARERGLLKEEPETLSDKKIWSYIFEPGFSTAHEVSEISGRGVGMDVVKKNLEKLRGRIDIDSKQDKGSKFTLRIPLTLAILDGMLIRVGKTTYAIPILTIKQSFRPESDSITMTMDGQEIVKVRENLYPVIRLHDVFKTKPDVSELEKGILIMVEGNKRVCIFADEIIEQQQIVVKGFDNYIGDTRGIMGCMILGTGEIGLILDIDTIIEMSEK